MGLREIVKAIGYRLGRSNFGGMRQYEMTMPPSWGYQSYLKAYGEIGWLYAVVNVIAQAVSKVQWHLYQVDSKGERNEISNHPLIDLMHKVNPFQTRYQFFYLGTLYKLLVGEEFWQLNFNGKGQPAEMWLAPPSFMSIIPSATDYISHYEFMRAGMAAPIKFNIEEIIHIKSPNPYNEYRGLSPAQALTIDLDSEKYAARYQQKLFYNDGTPGFILEYPPENLPSQEIRKELMQEWDERFKGYRNRGKTAFLWGGKPNVLTMTNRDMDFGNLRKYTRDAIMGAYHVPRSIIGITEDVNRANAEAAQYTFAQYCVQPELVEIRESINEQLCPLFGQNLEYDYENPVPEDETMKINNAVNLFKNKIINRNDALNMVGMDELEDELGEEYFAGTAPSPFGGFESFGLKKKSMKIEAEAFWKRYVELAEPYEKQLIAKLNEIFGEVEKKVIGNIDDGHRTSIFDRNQLREDYINNAGPILKITFYEAIKAGKELVQPENPHKQEDIPPILNQAALDWLNRRIIWAAAEIGETLARELNEALIIGFTNGESIPQLTKRVQEFFDSPARAHRIARTETIAASAQGTLEGYKETGIVRKTEFYTAADERTCDYCMEYHEVQFNLGEEMPIPLHPNCRCVYLPVIEEV